MQTLKVKAQRVGPVRNHHPWVFSGALFAVPEGLAAGEPVRLEDEQSRFLATGYFNSYSQIAVRVWGYEDGEEPTLEFFVKRIRQAMAIRAGSIDQLSTNAFRVVNAESDGLPGLVVDKYDRWLAVQFHTKGIERWRDMIVQALMQELSPDGIYERSDVAVRRMRGEGEPSGLLAGDVPQHVTITENNFKFIVDLHHGQKSGFFLDQRDKRAALGRYAKGLSVLNCFSYTGGFSVYALAGGAAEVTDVDVSAPALELAKENIRINGLDTSRHVTITADVKDFLRQTPPQYWDAIVLDPPAFVKDRRKKVEGIRGYKGINESAFRALKPGGLLVTCSCSAHVTDEEFRYMLSEAAGVCGRGVRIVESFGHGPDHCVLLPFTEGNYLKCLFMRA